MTRKLQDNAKNPQLKKAAPNQNTYENLRRSGQNRAKSVSRDNKDN